MLQGTLHTAISLWQASGNNQSKKENESSNVYFLLWNLPPAAVLGKRQQLRFCDILPPIFS